MNNLLPAKTDIFDMTISVAEGKVNIKVSRKIEGGEWSARFTDDLFTFKGAKQGNSLLGWFQVKPDGSYAKGVCSDHVQPFRKEGIKVDKNGSINLEEAKRALDVIMEGKVVLNGCSMTKSRLEEIVAFADEIRQAGKLFSDLDNLLKSKIVSDYVEKKKMQTMFLK